MELHERVNEVLEKVRPALQMDGGDIELVEVDTEEGVATVKLGGACGGCPMRNMTIKGYVERVVVAEVPEISEVRLA